MAARPAASPVVKLSELTDIASAIPYALGFHPTESLVAIALRGPRERLSFTMRLDLLPDTHDDAVAQMCAERMQHARAAAVLVAIYTSAARRPGLLPRSALVEKIQRALPMGLRDAVLVDNGRVWSYLCADPRCCPLDGRELSAAPNALDLAAAHALGGTVVLPDRDALVATAAPVGGVAAVSMRQALERAWDEVVTLGRDPDAAGTALELVDQLCAGYADGPVTLTHDAAARLTLWLHNVGVRDLLLGRLARTDEVLFRLVSDLCRLAQPPYDAPAATMFGMAAYFRGDGVVALAAAERALASDPDYSLAKLLAQAINGQLNPKRMRRIWAQTSAQHRG